MSGVKISETPCNFRALSKGLPTPTSQGSLMRRSNLTRRKAPGLTVILPTLCTPTCYIIPDNKIKYVNSNLCRATRVRPFYAHDDRQRIFRFNAFLLRKRYVG